MARRYWFQIAGRKVYPPITSLRHAEEYAQHLADQLGRQVRWSWDHIANRSGTAARVYNRNPFMGGEDFTGEEWKITAKGPYGQFGHAYATTQKEAELEARLIRARGWRVTHIVRLKAPNLPPKKRRRGR